MDKDLTRALLHWISDQVNELADKMSEKRRAEKKTWDLKQSSLFNQLLDRWKNKFMAKLTSELFGGIGIGDASGGTGGGGVDRLDDQDPSLISTQLVPREDLLVSWVEEHQQAAIIPNVEQENRFLSVKAFLDAFQCGHHLIAAGESAALAMIPKIQEYLAVAHSAAAPAEFLPVAI